MNRLLRLAWIFLWPILSGRVVNRAKRKGIIFYLKALQATRYGLIALLLGFFILQIIILAGVGALITGLMLLHIEQHTLILLLFILFSLLFFVPVGFLCIALSERVWYKYSGAEKLVETLHD